MRHRRWIGKVVVAVCLAVLLPGPALAGAADPKELWKAYPLDQGAGSSRSAAQPTPRASATPTPERAPAEPLPSAREARAPASGGGVLGLATPVLVLLAAALAASCLLAVRVSAHRRPRRTGASAAPPSRERPARRTSPSLRFQPAGRRDPGRSAPATCTIRLHTGMRRAQFHAIAFRPDGTWVRLGHSSPFTVNGEGAEARTPEAAERLEELERRLEEAGWTPAGSGRTWYEREFQRPGGS